MHGTGNSIRSQTIQDDTTNPRQKKRLCVRIGLERNTPCTVGFVSYTSSEEWAAFPAFFSRGVQSQRMVALREDNVVGPPRSLRGPLPSYDFDMYFCLDPVSGSVILFENNQRPIVSEVAFLLVFSICVCVSVSVCECDYVWWTVSQSFLFGVTPSGSPPSPQTRYYSRTTLTQEQRDYCRGPQSRSRDNCHPSPHRQITTP